METVVVCFPLLIQGYCHSVLKGNLVILIMSDHAFIDTLLLLLSFFTVHIQGCQKLR